MFKSNYRREMIKSMVEEDKSVSMFLKTVTIKEAMYLSDRLGSNQARNHQELLDQSPGRSHHRRQC